MRSTNKGCSLKSILHAGRVGSFYNMALRLDECLVSWHVYAIFYIFTFETYATSAF